MKNFKVSSTQCLDMACLTLDLKVGLPSHQKQRCDLHKKPACIMVCRIFPVRMIRCSESLIFFKFPDGLDDSGKGREPAIVITGSDYEDGDEDSIPNPLMAPVGSRPVSMINNINEEASRNRDYSSDGEIPNGIPMPSDPKEQKKSFMKMLNEKMKALSENLQGAVKNYHKLVRERNSCFEVLALQPPRDGSADDLSLEAEIRKVLEETGYEPKPREGEGMEKVNRDDGE